MPTESQDLIILTSPPASGKTYWVSKLKEVVGSDQILVISPLRALADECREKWGESILVMTPEEWLTKKIFSKIVIFDEFHLFFYWGDSFRPLMWEVFFELSLLSTQTWLLTATLSEEMKQGICSFSSQFDQILWLNHGNQILKYKPYSYLKAPDKKWVMSQIENEAIGKNVKLIFCQYREEVFSYAQKLTRLGFSCLTCVGGESKYMVTKLKNNPSPDFIISTTVLSHGVNLPDIKKIYFLYTVNNLDFWIQMTARGGRRGQDYQVIALDVPQGLEWNSWQNYIQILWHNFVRFTSLKYFFLKT